MFEVADAAIGAIQVQISPAGLLAEGNLGWNAPGGGKETRSCLVARLARDVPAVQGGT